MSAPAFVCPAPLVLSTENVYYTETVLGNCVVPCPSIEYTDEQWSNLVTTLATVSSTSTVLTLISLCCHLYQHKKYFIQVMWIGGFFLNSLIQAIFLFANYDNSIVCYGKAHFIEKGGLCVFQSSAMIFLLLWVECWSVIFFYDLFQKVRMSSQMKLYNSKEIKIIYTVSAFVISASLTAIPLAESNIGFDPLANIPFCLYMFSNYKLYFWWTLFVPMLVLVVVALLFCFMYSWKVHQIFRVSVVSDTFTGRCAQRVVSDDDVRMDSRESVITDGGSLYSGHNPVFDERDTSAGLELSEGHDQTREQRAGESLADHSLRPSSISVNPMQGDRGMRDDRLSAAPSGVVSVAGHTRGSSNSLLWGIFPVPVATFLKTTWRYNGVPIVFVSTYCLSTMAIAGIIWQLFHVTYDGSIAAGEEFAGCLITASFMSQALGIPQDQASVNAFAQSQCGSLPTDRPNIYLVYIMLVWTSGYGIIATLVFGFAGFQKRIFPYLFGTAAGDDSSRASARTVSSATQDKSSL